jgi:DMSO/TMAO reductase YedYZ molybdopterin-dependent catalytic subunit
MLERIRRAHIPGGVGAGVGAAIVMMLVMAVVRFTTNTPSLPEILEEPLIHLAGGQVEAFFINNFGVGGKALLLVSIIEGTLLLGAALGLLFTRVWPLRAAVPGWRWLSGLVYGLLVGLGLNVIVLPLFGQGFFGSSPTAVTATAPPNIATMLYGTNLAPFGLPMWFSMFLLSAVFGVALVALLPWPKAVAVGAPAAVTPVAAGMLDRRDFMRALGGVGLALVGGVGLWAAFTRALAPPSVAGLVEVDLNATPTPEPTELAQLPAATEMVPTEVPPTEVPPTEAPPEATAMPAEPPTEVIPGEPSPTAEPPTEVPPTEAPPTEVPPTEAPPTAVPTQSAFAGIKPVLVPEITPVESFYITTKNFLDPTVDGNSWTLKFSGLVDSPYSLNLKDLQALPSLNRIQTLACISNPIGGDLIGNARWKGVSFRDLLQRAKPQADAADVVVRGEDGLTDSFPMSVALNNDCVLVYEMNGAPLTQKHGYPARLLVPNIYGMKNCKWITEVQLVNYDYKGYWEGQGWSDTAVYNTLSRIDYPADNSIPAKPIYIGGVAFAGNRGIKRVEVSTDGGNTWNDAQLRPALGKYTWVLWVYPWQPKPGNYKLLARATDGTGKVQTSQVADTYPDGATGYHSRQVRVG